ncbi:MAG: transaldolase [Flavisolibacter sp.]
MTHSNINKIRDLGQSIWLDFFDRDIMDSEKLKTLIEETGISGVTSNPSIFEKAISTSSDFDEDISALSQTQTDDGEIFFSLAVKDIQRAADLLKKVYDNTEGEDGFVSLEVSPYLAHDTEGTMKQARKLWQKIGKQNAMVKIPATQEGLPAIRKCISEGININITLLFGLPRYQQVVNAYISGLEDRLRVGKPIKQIASVASFFLSRIDVMVDPLLEKRGLSRLQGQVAIASAKRAYEMYKNAFTNPRFKSLEDNGAKRQHLLWASTSSKNPAFSDVKYVDALVGAETINTITLETLAAFQDHGTAQNSLGDNIDNANETLESLKKASIDLDEITQKLENDGIEKFNVAYQAIMKAIERKKNNHKL